VTVQNDLDNVVDLSTRAREFPEQKGGVGQVRVAFEQVADAEPTATRVANTRTTKHFLKFISLCTPSRDAW
jgi:hypothetical protein